MTVPEPWTLTCPLIVTFASAIDAARAHVDGARDVPPCTHVEPLTVIGPLLPLTVLGQPMVTVIPVRISRR